tara:strand:+ start:655 stop:1914 length:1260 start_codon:yes stop_codon:yes gene_type:complete
MYWLIETEEQLLELSKFGYEEAFVELISYSNTIHPVKNKICAVYIRPLNSTKGFITSIDHSETLPLNIDIIISQLNAFKKIYVRDKKEFLHYFILKDLYDITLNSPPYIQEYTQTHNFFNSKYPNKLDVNRIIPIVKHYEYCEKLFNNLKSRINEPINDFYNSKTSVVFNALEQSGLRIDRGEFQSRFHDVSGEYVHTQFNFKTLTGRPSNKFGGVNYASLNKENGDRKCFIPRNNFLFELDIGAYHPTLLGKLVGYDFGEEDIHMAFSEMYGVDYQKSKELTFKQMYGGVFEQYKELEFFKKMKVYTDDLWARFQNEGSIECPISKHIYKKDELEDMKPQKLLNYVLQNLETAMNVCILWEIFKILKGKNTKLVLYTFDSFLLDVDENEKKVIEEILKVFKNKKLQIKYNYGSTYDFR